MKRSLLAVSLLASTLMAGAVQAKEVPAQAPAPAQVTQHQTLQRYAEMPGYEGENGVPGYLMSNHGTLINGLQPTGPNAQG